MKALTVKQPWAWAIVSGGKDIENRGWDTNFRGTFAIHASGNLDESAEQNLPAGCPPLACLPRQAIVGVADLVDVVRVHDSRWFEGPYGFLLANARPLSEPIPCPGARWFWDLPAEIESQIARQSL